MFWYKIKIVFLWGLLMDIEKLVSEANIKYFCGDNCMLLTVINFRHIFDESNKIYFMIKGDCSFILETPEGNISHKLTTGEMILIPAGMRHSILKEINEGEDTSQKLWVSFQFDTCGKNLFDLYSFPYIIKPKKPKYTEKLIESVIDLGRQNSLISGFKLNAAIINLVTYFLEESNAVQKENTGYSMDSIVQYINDNLSHDFSLDELAAMAHMHPTYFIERFKALKGTSPMKYIMAKRMRHARHSLEHSNLSITEISTNVGFKDPGHFSKVFKKYYDFSPAQYRKINSKIGASAKSPIYKSLDQLDTAHNEVKSRKKHTT